MSQDSKRERRPAHLIVEAGEILRKLSPSRLAMLRFVMDDEIKTQTEMADRLGISTSTVTTDLQKLANLPLSLVQKLGTNYSITGDGKTVFGIFDRRIQRLGIDIDGIDWETGTGKLESCLDPLHNSRSSMPFFVLHSIAGRSDRSDIREVWISDVVADVNHWQEERGKTATRKQVQWMLGRFEDAGVVVVNDQVTLTEDKGEEHAHLLAEVIEQLEDNHSDTSQEPPSVSSPQQGPTADTTEQGTESAEAEDVRSQPTRQQFPIEDQTVTDSMAFQPIVPTIQLAQDTSTENSGPSRKSPVVPLSSPTVKELVDQLNWIGREYGHDAQLELNWMVRTDRPTSEVNTDIRHWLADR